MSQYAIPILFVLILASALYRHVPVYSVFLEGAEEGMKTVWSIFPAMLAMLTAVAMLRASGAFSWLLTLLSPLTKHFSIPEEVLPLALMRPLSGSGALGILSDLLSRFSPDSDTGRIASVLMGSTETTFYTLSVYFRRTRVKYTKKIIPAALLGDLAGLLAAVHFSRIF